MAAVSSRQHSCGKEEVSRRPVRITITGRTAPVPTGNSIQHCPHLPQFYILNTYRNTHERTIHMALWVFLDWRVLLEERAARRYKKRMFIQINFALPLRLIRYTPAK